MISGFLQVFHSQIPWLFPKNFPWPIRDFSWPLKFPFSSFPWPVETLWFAPCSRQIIMPVPHQSVLYRPDAFLATQRTVSKHWKCYMPTTINWIHKNKYWLPKQIKQNNNKLTTRPLGPSIKKGMLPMKTTNSTVNQFPPQVPDII